MQLNFPAGKNFLFRVCRQVRLTSSQAHKPPSNLQPLSLSATKLVGTNFLSTHPPSLAHNPTAKQNFLKAKAVRHQEWLSASVEPVTSRRPGSAEHVSRRVPASPDPTAEVNKTPRTNDGTCIFDTCSRSPRRKLVTPKLRHMRFPHGISYDSGLMYRHTKHFLGINCARPNHLSSVRIGVGRYTLRPTLF